MSVTLKDVARAAGVSESAVSLVVNGKAMARGITPATQARIATTVRQLGYQPEPISRRIALHQGGAVKPPRPVQAPTIIAPVPPGQMTGQLVAVILSTSSPVSSLALIPELEATLVTAGRRVLVMVFPVDPASVRERMGRLPDGVTGILACPTIYQTVSASLAGMCRVPVPPETEVIPAPAVSEVQPESVDDGVAPEPDAQAAPVVAERDTPPYQSTAASEWIRDHEEQ